MIAFLAFVLASCLAAAVFCELQAARVRKHAEELQREYEKAVKAHGPSREIGRELVLAKCRQIKQECGV